MKKLALFVLFATAALGETDPWQPVKFLFGAWDAKTAADAQASGSYSFEPDLNGHVVVRRSVSADCKPGSESVCEHSDVLYIFSDAPGTPLKAIYFDNEGHVIHYNVSVPSPGAVVLLSDASQPGPQYRLSYELKSGVMSGKFQVKVPGQSDFKSYLEWSGKQR